MIIISDHEIDMFENILEAFRAKSDFSYIAGSEPDFMFTGYPVQGTMDNWI